MPHGAEKAKRKQLLPLWLVLLCACLGLQAKAQTKPAPVASQPQPVRVEAKGAVDVPAETVPLSGFLSPEAKAYVNQHLHDMQDPAMTYAEKGFHASCGATLRA